MSAREEGRRYSKTVLKTISAGTVGCIGDAPALSERDIADLKGILDGTKPADGAVDTRQAMTVLTHAEPSPESAGILGRILARDDAPVKVRTSAAANLGRFGGEAAGAAESALLGGLDTKNRFVRSEIIESLGKVGSTESLRRLGDLVETASEADRRRARFACTAIAFREGRYDEEAFRLFDWRSHPVGVLEGEPVAERVRDLWGPRWGVELNREVALTLPCGGATLSVLLNRELRRGSWLETLQERPLVAGILAAEEREVGRHSVRNVVLTVPTDTGFDIAVARSDGNVVFAGRGEPDGDGFRLTIRDVGLERVPAWIEGRLTAETFDLTLRTWAGRVRDKRHGQAVQR